MINETMSLVVGAVALVLGAVVGWALRHMKAKSAKNNAEARAEQMLKDAKSEQQQLVLEAKEKALEVIEEAKKEEQTRRSEIKQLQDRLEKRENMFDQRLDEIEKQKEAVEQDKAEIAHLREELQQGKEKQLEQIQKIAGLDTEQAKEVLLKKVAEDESEALASRIQKLKQKTNEEFDAEAREILTLAIQRCGMSHSAETTSTVLRLPSDEMKGRIIGKEGRNIKALEEETGVEIIVDDTPESILLSAFSPIRRHVAKRALERLMEDGRIHPARIEDVVAAVKKDLAKEIQRAGEEALLEMGLTGIEPKLIQLLGRLRYRTSYGQNVLRHSIEVGIVAGLIAEQMGADVQMARKAGLFHDIGKALDHDIQGTHPEIGRDIGRKFQFSQELSDAAFCHHDDNPPTTEAVIVKVADCISGGRPGARKDSYEQYIQRLEELEETTKSFEGVEKAYAIQAGREVRVFVNPTEVDDYKANELAKDIARKIEAELKYPGEIKVNVIRRNRIIEYARQPIRTL